MPRFYKYNKSSYQNNYDPMEFDAIKPRREERKGLNKEPQGKKQRKPITCYRCGKQGHIKRNCRQGNAQKRLQGTMRVTTEELQGTIVRTATPYPPPQNSGTDDDVSDLEEIEEGEVATDAQGIESIEESSGSDQASNDDDRSAKDTTAPLAISKGHTTTAPNILILQLGDTHLVVQDHFLDGAYGMKIDFQRTYDYNKTYGQVDITLNELRNKLEKKHQTQQQFNENITIQETAKTIEREANWRNAN